MNIKIKIKINSFIIYNKTKNYNKNYQNQKAIIYKIIYTYNKRKIIFFIINTRFIKIKNNTILYLNFQIYNNYYIITYIGNF